MSRPRRDVDFTIVTMTLRKKECLSIDFIALNTQKPSYNFRVRTLLNSTSHKITAKKRYSLSMFTAFDEETTL